MNGQPETQRESQIETQIRQIEKELERQSAVITELKQRLEGVLRLVDIPEEKEAKDVTLVPLANRLRSIKYSLEAHTNELSYAIERIEL